MEFVSSAMFLCNKYDISQSSGKSSRNQFSKKLGARFLIRKTRTPPAHILSFLQTVGKRRHERLHRLITLYLIMHRRADFDPPEMVMVAGLIGAANKNDRKKPLHHLSLHMINKMTNVAPAQIIPPQNQISKSFSIFASVEQTEPTNAKNVKRSIHMLLCDTRVKIDLNEAWIIGEPHVVKTYPIMGAVLM